MLLIVLFSDNTTPQPQPPHTEYMNKLLELYLGIRRQRSYGLRFMEQVADFMQHF